MTRTNILLVVAAGSVVIFFGGCATVRGTAPVNVDHSSPLGVMKSHHEGAVAGNYAQMLECWAPNVQRNIDGYLVACRDQQVMIERIGQLIEERIGHEEAEYFRSRDPIIGAPNSFFASIAEDGRVNWEEVTIRTQEKRAQAFICDTLVVETRKIDGKWYLVRPSEEQSDVLVIPWWMVRRRSTGAMRAYADLEARVKSGRLDRNSFWEFVWHPGFERPGPSVDGACLQLSPRWRKPRKDELPSADYGRMKPHIVYEKNEPLIFEVFFGTNHVDENSLCLPKRDGTGQVHVVELDGKVFPVTAGPDKAVFASSGMVGNWTFELPKDKVSVGWHKLQYKIVSEGGTYKRGDGTAVRIPKGTLVSNVMRFRLKQ